MKQQQKRKILPPKKANLFAIPGKKQVAAADSPEVLYHLHQDKLICLQAKLDMLNLLDHPCEVESICRDIIRLKTKLEALAVKYKIANVHAFR